MDDDEDDEPVTSEDSQGLLPLMDPSEETAKESAIPPEKKPHLQKASSEDR
jgi:hypothetical protein